MCIDTTYIVTARHMVEQWSAMGMATLDSTRENLRCTSEVLRKENADLLYHFSEEERRLCSNVFNTVLYCH